jgi:hypothetical protein
VGGACWQLNQFDWTDLAPIPSDQPQPNEDP